MTEGNASKYRITTVSCFVGIFVQAIITNLMAILFIPLLTLYNFHYGQLGIIVGINFAAQVSADIIFSGLIDKIGYKRIVVPANIGAFIGLLMLALSPVLFPNNVFLGIIIGTIIFAFCSGLLEVVLSPIVDGIPYKNKGPAMSLMHSFYAWGQALTIIITTLALLVFGKENWQWIVVFWMLIPFINFFMFLKAPVPEVVPAEKRSGIKSMLKEKFFVFALLAIMFGGAAEVTMNQWSSAFMEVGLQLPKVQGDLLGMCGFAIMIGVGRTLYGFFGSKMDMHKVLIFGGILSLVCYLGVALSPSNAISVIMCVICGFATSLLWPGTIVVSSARFPFAGAWMFAILAAAGDIGASIGPWITGIVVDSTIEGTLPHGILSYLNLSIEQTSVRMGILASAIFPLLVIIVHVCMYREKKKKVGA